MSFSSARAKKALPPTGTPSASETFSPRGRQWSPCPTGLPGSRKEDLRRKRSALFARRRRGLRGDAACGCSCGGRKKPTPQVSEDLSALLPGRPKVRRRSLRHARFRMRRQRRTIRPFTLRGPALRHGGHARRKTRRPAALLRAEGKRLSSPALAEFVGSKTEPCDFYIISSKKRFSSVDLPLL